MAVRLGDLDDAALDELRQIGDEDADAVAARLRRRYPGLDENDLVRIVLRDLGRREQAGDETVRRWMFEGPDLPDWADVETIRAGQAFFGDWPLAITTALFCVSLPCAYAAADGSRVLGVTSAFATKNASRRIAETGQMLMDVMDLDGGRPETVRPGGTGYATIRGVRLLHAVVRRTLLSDPGIVWRREEWGVPVNQEDLLGTLTTFTVAVFQGLDRLGIPYTRDEANAYLHTWCVIGELLGIRPDLLPLELDEAEELADVIARRHHERSEAGDRLMAELLRQMEVSMPWGLRKLPRTLLHHLLPPEVVRLFALPAPARWRPLLALGCRVGPGVARLPGGRWLIQAPAELVGRSMIRMYVDRALAGEGPPFRVAPDVAARLSVGLSQPRRTLRNRRRRIRTQRRAHKVGSAAR